MLDICLVKHLFLEGTQTHASGEFWRYIHTYTNTIKYVYIWLHIHIYMYIYMIHVCIYTLHVFHCLLLFTIREMIPFRGSNQASQLLGPSLKWQTAVTLVEGSCCDGTVTWAAVGGVTWWDDVVVGGYLCRTSMDITFMAFGPHITPEKPRQADVVLRNVLCSLLERCGHWPRTRLSRCHQLLPTTLQEKDLEQAHINQHKGSVCLSGYVSLKYGVYL